MVLFLQDDIPRVDVRKRKTQPEPYESEPMKARARRISSPKSGVQDCNKRIKKDSETSG
jgi:hypothetical protein